jgi:hypothetical protein
MAEVFQVGRAYLPYLWGDWQRILKREPLGGDLIGLHRRLMLGEETAWIVLAPDDPHTVALILTRHTPARLLIHLVGSRRRIESWIDNAVERLSAYARLLGCQELRILARKGWKEYAARFTREPGLKVLFSRDRPTRLGHGWQNTVGRYRGVETCSRPLRTIAI